MVLIYITRMGNCVIFAGLKQHRKMNIGNETGELCNRDGCKGIIEEHEKEGSCSCHINPPCSYCVDDAHYCPECDWQGIDDQKSHGNVFFEKAAFYEKILNDYSEARTNFYKKYHSGDPVEKLEYRIESHTHFSQKVIGMFPKDMPRSEITDKIKGTFGGRYEKLGETRFEYIAYTD